MATHDYVIDNSTGANVRADINSVLQAILTNNSSSSAPSTTAAYMFWADTTSGTLKIRNSSDNAWVELLQLDGTLTLEDGSVSAPALAFRDDLDTGIFSSAQNTINFATAGVERLELGSSLTVFNESGADVDFRIEGDTNANLFYVNAGNNRVGIGTSSPNSLLDVSALGASDEPTFKVSSENSTIFLRTAGSSGAFPTGGGGNDGELLYFGGDFRVGIGTASKNLIFFNGSSYQERMRIDSSGNVGVGTTSPDLPLHVEGTSNADEKKLLRLTNAGGSAGTTAVMEFECGVDEIATISANNAGGDIGNLMFGTATSQNAYPTEKMRITSAGNVGIGTTSPASPLHLHESSSGSIEGLKVTNSTTGTGLTDGLSIGLQSDEDVFIHNYENTAIHFATNDTTRLSILAGGGLTFNGDTAAANALDDYEEGTFTMHFNVEGESNLSMAGRVGEYVKIGRTVHIIGGGTCGSVTNQSTSKAIDFTNLPFAMVNTGVGSTGHPFPVNTLELSSSGMSSMAGSQPYTFRGRLNNNTTNGRIVAYKGDGDQNPQNASLALQGNSQIYCMFTYVTAA